MKCPLASFYRSWPSGEIALQKEDCLKEECAWWRKEYPACCIYSIERALWAIAAELGTIMARMPERRRG